MSDDYQWYRIQFDFAIPNADVDFTDIDRKKFLLGLGRATSILLLDPDMEDEERSRLKILVKELTVDKIDFLTDYQLEEAMEKFRRAMGDSDD